MSDVRNEILKLRSDVSTGRKIIAGLVLVLFVLVALLFKSSGSFSQTIIPPNLSQPFTVTNNEISPSYLEDMAVWVAYLSEDYTPKSIEYKQEKLKKLFNPEVFGVMEVELQKKKDYVTRNGISSSFQPIQVKINPDRMEVLITGTEKTTVGDKPLPQKSMSILVGFSFNHGMVEVVGIKAIDQLGKEIPVNEIQ